MPLSSASRIAATESWSSWAPQANPQPEPPMAQAPKPIGVMYRSEFPNCLVFMVASSLKKLAFVVLSATRQRKDRATTAKRALGGLKIPRKTLDPRSRGSAANGADRWRMEEKLSG